MDFYEAVKTRQSIRQYKSDPIPEDVLKRVLEAVQASPSWANVQPWEFILVTGPETLAKHAIPCIRAQEFGTMSARLLPRLHNHVGRGIQLSRKDAPRAFEDRCVLPPHRLLRPPAASLAEGSWP